MTRWALVQGGIVVTTIDADTMPATSWPRATWVAAPGDVGPGATFDGGAWSAALAYVPPRVTKRQGRQALLLAGKLNLVQPAIDAVADATQRALLQIEWDDSQFYERHRPTLVVLAKSGLGMTDTDLDTLFRLADTL